MARNTLLRSLFLGFSAVLAAVDVETARGGEPGSFVLMPGASWQPPPEASSSGLRARLQKIVEMEQRRYRRGPNDAVFAPSCVQTPTLSDFFDRLEVSGPKRVPAAIGGALPDLRAPATRIVDLFTVLRHTRWGTAVLKKFMPRFGFDIKIEHYTDAMREEEWRRGRLVAAIYDINRKTIYVDKQASLGDVAPILLHEIIHSLDNDFARSVEREKRLWNDLDDLVDRALEIAARRTGKPETELERSDFLAADLDELRRRKTAIDEFRAVRTYRAERVAYDLYSEIVAELASLAPSYYRGISPAHPPRFSDDALVAAEHLDPDVIARYRSGRCRTTL